MENNPELQLAWQFIENTGTHLFLTGKAGTGKTTFLNEFVLKTKKKHIVVAPTGIAAINAGATIVNDVSGLQNLEMLKTCVELKAPTIICWNFFFGLFLF